MHAPRSHIDRAHYLQEATVAEFEQKKREREEQAEAKTAKNRAKRQKKKERAKSGKEGEVESNGRAGGGSGSADVPLKKRRLVNGQQLVFKRPGEEDSDEDDTNQDEVGPMPGSARDQNSSASVPDMTAVPVIEAQRIIIHEED